MSLAFLVYLMQVLGNLGYFLGIAGIVLTIFGGMATAFCWVEENSSYSMVPEGAHKKTKKLAIVGGIFLFLSVFVPSKETMYTMAAAHTVQTISESEEVRDLASESFGLLEDSIKKWREEVQKELN